MTIFCAIGRSRFKEKILGVIGDSPGFSETVLLTDLEFDPLRDSRAFLADDLLVLDSEQFNSLRCSRFGAQPSPIDRCHKLLLVWPDQTEVVPAALQEGIREWLLIDSEGAFLEMLPSHIRKILGEESFGAEGDEGVEDPQSEAAASWKGEPLGDPEKIIETEVRQPKNRMERDFLAIMSHEIRTPMSSVIGFTELLQQTDLDAEQKEFARIILSNGRSLLELINNILDFSKMETGQLELDPHPFSLEGILREIISNLSLAADLKGLALRYDISPAVPDCMVADRGRVGQVLTNLIYNGIKFTPSGEVFIKVDAEPQIFELSWTVQFTVSDTGKGIPSDQLECLFEPFTQVISAENKRCEGTGLGLAICRRVAEAIGGACWAESEYGGGSRFFFTFLASEARSDESEGAAPTVFLDSGLGQKHPLRILVAEDDKNNRKVLKEFLEQLGYKDVLTATDGVETMAVLREAPVDMILMDVRMPGIDGIEVTRRIRSGEAGDQARGVHIVAATAYALPGDREKLMQAGMNDYLRKPFDVREFQSVLRHAAKF